MRNAGGGDQEEANDQGQSMSQTSLKQDLEAFQGCVHSDHAYFFRSVRVGLRVLKLNVLEAPMVAPMEAAVSVAQRVGLALRSRVPDPSHTVGRIAGRDLAATISLHWRPSRGTGTPQGQGR